MVKSSRPLFSSSAALSPPQIYDVAERDKLANAFAEIGVLLHLAGWHGAVKLLDYGRHEDKVRALGSTLWKLTASTECTGACARGVQACAEGPPCAWRHSLRR